MQNPTTLLIVSALCAVLSPIHGALLSHYQLDGNTTDSGSVGANGTLNGTTSFVNNAPGNYSQSLDLTASGSNYMEANIGSAYDGLDKITLTLWVNLQGTPSTNDRLLSNMEASSLDSFDLRWGNSTTPSSFLPQFNVNTTNDPAVSPLSYNGDDTWVFVAVSYDSTLGSDQVSFYKGSESSATTFLGADGETGTLDASSLFRIGSTPASGSDRTPPAYFSDVRVYDEVLSLGQIESVRNAVIPEPSTFLMLCSGLSLVAMAMTRRR